MGWSRCILVDFFCAEADGRITLSRPKCYAWECFVASPDWCDTLIGPNATELEAAVSAQIDWEGIRSFRGQSRPAEYVPNPQVEPVDGRIIGARQSTEASALPYAERRFALRRVIVMRHRGRFANKMI